MSEKEFAQKIYQKSLENACKCLKSRAEMMKTLALSLEKSADKLSDPTRNPQNEFNWAINDIENMLRNLNFAEMARLTPGESPD